MIGSVLFTAILFVSVLPYSLAIVIVAPFNRASAYQLAVAWARMICGACARLCNLRFEIDGQDNLPERPAVFLLKHSSAYETIVQMLIVPRQTWVLKRELMWAPFLGWGLAALQPIAIDRGGGGSAVSQVLEQGVARLRAGIQVMIFPEGTRMPAGETRRYGLSGVLLAQQAGTVLVPIAHNAGYYWPRRGLRKRPGVVRFSVGRPVDPAGRDPREVNAEIQQWMERRVAELNTAA